MKISIIIPCYNEEKSIGLVIKKIKQSVPSEILEEIIVIDNNSTDKSAEIAKQHGAKVIKETKQGYGAALKAGFKKANGQLIATLDADGQYPAELIPEIINYLIKNNLDFISCNRVPFSHGSQSFTRKLGNWLLTVAANIIFNIKLKDSQSGMWIFKKSVLNKIWPKSDDMPLSEEIKILAAIHPEIKFEEYYIPYRPRIGESKLFPIKHGLKNLLYLFKLKKEIKKNKNQKKLIHLNLTYITFFILILAYLFAGLYNINHPFINVTEDVSGQNGIAALNWNKFGWFNLKFGFFINWIRNINDIYGNAYAHHPSLFLAPTAILYKIFGITEATTRLGLFLYIIISLILFFIALIKLFENRLTLFIILSFIIMPGAIYYGKSFELTVFTIPSALITWSLFILFYKTESVAKKFFYFWIFIISILIGCQMAWFYYFTPLIIWLILITKFGKEIPKRKILIFLIPILLLISFFTTLLQFYLLNGQDFLNNLKSAFLYRTKSDDMSLFLNPGWIQRIWWITKLNITPLMFLIGLAGIIIWLINLKNNKNFILLSPLIIYPFLVIIIFKQWATHPFGVIPFLPAIAIGSGIFLDWLIKKYKEISIFFIIIILSYIIYNSYQNLNFFYNEFLILHQNDIELAKELNQKMDIKDYQVCLGKNPNWIDISGILGWYTKKIFDISEKCPENKNSNFALVHNPSFGQEAQQEIKRFEEYGYKFIGCAGFLCLMEK